MNPGSIRKVHFAVVPPGESNHIGPAPGDQMIEGPLGPIGLVDERIPGNDTHFRDNDRLIGSQPQHSLVDNIHGFRELGIVRFTASLGAVDDHTDPIDPFGAGVIPLKLVPFVIGIGGRWRGRPR